MTTCLLCDAAHANYREAVAHLDKLDEAEATAREKQTADDHMWCCLDEYNHAEAQHALGAHADVAAQERVA